MLTNPEATVTHIDTTRQADVVTVDDPAIAAAFGGPVTVTFGRLSAAELAQARYEQFVADACPPFGDAA